MGLGAASLRQASLPAGLASDAAESQFQRARLLVGALVRAGVRRAVTSPGSRSTPLVLAALDAAGSKTTVSPARTAPTVVATGKAPAALEVASVVDERAAAFFALGQARVTGMPTALICTSGSAPAHCFPAILEAREAGLPLIVLSADRPSERMDCASPQTADQTKLFGSAVNFFAEIDLGGRTDALSLRALRRTATQAVFRSRWPRGGAVHLNVRARKPLERSEIGEEHSLVVAVDRLLEDPLDVGVPGAAPDLDPLVRAARLCRRAERGLIVAGPLALPPRETRQTVNDVFGLAELARLTGFPLAAEATSQSRFVESDTLGGVRHLADCLGAAWAADGGKSLPAPDLVLQVGAPSVSAGAQRFLESGGAPRIVLSDGPWTDPAGRAAVFLFGDVAAVVSGLCSRLSGGSRGAARGRLQAAASVSDGDGWHRDVLALCRRYRAAVASLGVGTEDGGFHDGHAVRAAVEATPTGSLLMLGNSLPVRLVEDWVGRVERRMWVASQRGLSGIDGLVAGFLGSLSVGEFPAGVLLLGDVSLLHDLDGLTLASEYGDGPPAVVVVIDNGGGRIFERLPIASTEVFRSPLARHWLTPHAVDFAGLAQAFGIPYARVEELSAAEQAIGAAVRRRGVSLVVAGSAPGALARAEAALPAALASLPTTR